MAPLRGVRNLFMILASAFSLCVGLAAPPAAATVADAALLRDVQTYPDVGVSAPVRLGSSLLFTEQGRYTQPGSLWRTGGTAAGTTKLRSFPGGARSLTVAGNRVFFVADDGEHGRELWLTDGTSDGTVMVADIVAGPEGSSPSSLVAFGSGVAFDARTATPGLWVSDGTAAGTRLIRFSILVLEHLTTVGATLYFTVTSAAQTVQLWRSDGTATRTLRVKSWTGNVRNGIVLSSRITKLTALGDRLIFLRGDWWRETPGGDAVTQVGGSERSKLATGTQDPALVAAALWSSDGTAAGTVELASWDAVIWYAQGSLEGSPFCVVGSTLYFSKRVAATPFDTEGPGGLWRTDGTVAGTRVVLADFTVGGQAGITPPLEMAAVGDTVYFTTTDSEATVTNLWRSDGTPSGTVHLPFTAQNGFVAIHGLTASQGLLFFYAVDFNTGPGSSSLGSEVWFSDGTVAGTQLAADVNAGRADSLPQALSDLGPAAIWVAWDGTTTALWRSDGTSAGTASFASLDQRTAASNPTGFTRFGGQAYFGAGQALWRTDGTVAGTVSIASYQSYHGDPVLVAAGGQLFYSTERLMVTNGTAAGTRGVRCFSYANLPDAAVLGNRLTMTARPCSQEQPRLWTSDGTTAGTFRVPNAPSYDQSMNPTTAGRYVFFVDSDASHGLELWRTNGTLTDAMRITDIRRGAGSSAPTSLTAVGSRVFFVADDGVHGRELWVSDGSAAGTHLVRELRAGTASPEVQDLTAVGNRVYFTAWDAAHGRELWRSDGTAAGTVLVRDIRDGAASSVPQWLTAVGSTLYFTAWEGTHGRELWKSNGTTAGTVLVRDVNPGSTSSTPTQLTRIGWSLVFSANDGVHGAEPWRSDGTASSTQLLADVNPMGSSNSYGYAYTNGTLAFAADDGMRGSEPYAVPWFG